MNILITGGVGFIGTNAALYFAKNKKNKVTVVDNFSRAGVDTNARYLKKTFPKIEIIRSSIGNIAKYKRQLNRADAVIHLAGQTAVTTSIIKPDFDFKNNLFETFTLLEYLRKNNADAVIIYSSTNKVYGDLSRHQLKISLKKKRYEDICHPGGIDETEPLDFISPYGCSKGASDLYFLDYARIYNMNTVVFRQSCIYGPHQIGVEDQGWVAHFAKQFLFKKSLIIFGDGHQVRDLLYVVDLVKAYEAAIKNINRARGQAFNLGGSTTNAYSLLNVIEIMVGKFGYKIKINYSPPRVGDQKYFVSLNNKAKKILHWQPETDFKQGLDRLIDWQRKNL